MARPQAGGPRVFAYLKPEYAGLDNILGTLHDSGSSALAHVPGAARKTLQIYSTGPMVVSADPLDMAAMRAGCDLAICHGGAGTLAQAPRALRNATGTTASTRASASPQTGAKPSSAHDLARPAAVRGRHLQ